MASRQRDRWKFGSCCRWLLFALFYFVWFPFDPVWFAFGLQFIELKFGHNVDTVKSALRDQIAVSTNRCCVLLSSSVQKFVAGVPDLEVLVQSGRVASSGALLDEQPKSQEKLDEKQSQSRLLSAFKSELSFLYFVLLVLIVSSLLSCTVGVRTAFQSTFALNDAQLSSVVDYLFHLANAVEVDKAPAWYPVTVVAVLLFQFCHCCRLMKRLGSESVRSTVTPALRLEVQTPEDGSTIEDGAKETPASPRSTSAVNDNSGLDIKHITEVNVFAFRCASTMFTGVTAGSVPCCCIFH